MGISLRELIKETERGGKEIEEWRERFPLLANTDTGEVGERFTCHSSGVLSLDAHLHVR